jgi:hypothetical protein
MGKFSPVQGRGRAASKTNIETTSRGVGHDDVADRRFQVSGVRGRSANPDATSMVGPRQRCDVSCAWPGAVLLQSRAVPPGQ